MSGVREVRARLAEPWVVGMYTHTHSWDLRFDAAEYYPYYALALGAGRGVRDAGGYVRWPDAE